MTCSQLIAGIRGGPTAGICRTCGICGDGVVFEAWVKPTFTDHDKLVPGSIVCGSCLFCFSDENQELAEKVGKTDPQKMRNYSHFVINGSWWPLSKSHKSEMRKLLTECVPDVAVIADSGQKHLLFRAKPGWWQFEDKALLPDVPLLTAALADIDQLLLLGASKQEIAFGRYKRSTVASNVKCWSQIELRIKPMRGSLIFALAIFLAQRTDKGEVNDE